MAGGKRRQQPTDTRVPIKAHPRVTDDVSVASRVDGVSGAGTVRHRRKRTRWSKPRPSVSLDFLQRLVRFAPLWVLAAEFDVPRCGPGRPMETSPVCVFIIEALSHEYRSVRAAVEMLSDPDLWQWLVDAVEYAYPDHPQRRLPDEPITRDQYCYFKKHRLESDAAVTRVRELNRDFAIVIAHACGLGDPDVGSLTHPATSQVIAGDATHLRAMFNTSEEDAVDKDTGEILTRRYDPDALKYHADGEKTGHTMVSAIARNVGSNERVVLDLDLKPRGIGDATMFTDMALPLFARMPGMLVATYDMAMHAADKDRLLFAGVLPVTKTQLTKTGQRVAINIGEHTFRKPGKPASAHVITAIDGTPCITIATPDGPQEIELRRRQTKRRALASGGFTIGGFWRIPDQPIVPLSLRGAETWIHHNSTADEIARGKPRTRGLGPIPKSDPDFDPLFGVREDTESMHNHLKRPLINGRLRCVGRHRVLLNLHAYQLRTNMMALLAHHAGHDEQLEQWFGRSRPPGRRSLAA